jgi:two-component system, OmpR family, phosphate regulon response regulator OmpR
MSEMKILVIDDDVKLQDLLKQYLENREYKVYSHFIGSDVDEKIQSVQPDLIVLDIMLPNKSGLEVLKEIRTSNNIPILILTARGDDSDRIVGLELGSDDYLPKPFNPRELDARIRAILRRYNSNGSDNDKSSSQISIGELYFDRIIRTLKFQTKEVELSSAEADIFYVLTTDCDKIFTRDEIMNITKGRDFMGFERSIYVHVSKLRNKMDEIGAGGNRIQTIWGKGYRFIRDIKS